MPHTWDPDRYLTYADERGRPVRRAGRPRRRRAARAPSSTSAAGPGNLTALLADRWPDARVVGLDSSPEMIAKARADVARRSTSRSATCATGLTGDASRSTCSSRNATLQWVPGHLDLLPAPGRPRSRPGGWLAFQVPGNFDEPSHTIRTELAARGAVRRAHRRASPCRTRHDPAVYLDALRGARLRRSTPGRRRTSTCCTGEDPVFTWVSGTGARPTLQALPDDLRAAFEDGVQARGCARPTRPATDGVVLPFRRVFVVGAGAATDEAAPRPGRLPARRRGRRPTFYGDGLGLTEVEKPADLRARGGAWFRAYDDRGAVSAELHVGVEEPFAPARKAHPAFVRRRVEALDGGRARGWGAWGTTWTAVSGTPSRGYRRVHAGDAHGNRVELLA